MLNIGATVANRYVVEAVVGHGGMGAIYRAQDTRLGRVVALKVLRPDLAADGAARSRFLREGQIAAQMVHANVVRTYDAGEDQAGPFLVQELLGGRTLDQLIPLPPREAADILSAIAGALSYIHHRGYIHCDVKPQNILLKDDGTPVLLDFGIARAEGLDATTLIATPHYLAPERARGMPPTVASDLYALGIVLFQAITGRPPFDASTIHAIIQQHNDMPVPSLGIDDPAATTLDRVIARLTAKEPADRYASADVVQQDLAAIARNASHALPTMAVAPVAATAPAPQPTVAPVAAIPTPPARPPSEYVKLAAARWSRVPAWRKRRWIAYVVGPLLLLALGFAIARGNRAVALPTPGATPPPSLERTVPAVTGLQFEAAATELARVGLRAERGERSVAQQAEGIVLDSEPQVGATVQEGAVVVLHVSAGTPTTVPVVEPTAPTMPVVEPTAPPIDVPTPVTVEDGEGSDDAPGNSENRGNGKENNRGKDKDKEKDDDD
jgi:eukaryotic-like serine/threonine-protein kinase